MRMSDCASSVDRVLIEEDWQLFVNKAVLFMRLQGRGTLGFRLEKECLWYKARCRGAESL